MEVDTSRIKELRKEKALTQEAVSQAIGINRRNYVNIEHCDSVPRIETLIAIADLYDVSLDYLLNRSDKR